MKEKRYFCDWCEEELSKLTILALLFFMALTLVIISTIHYKIKINQKEAEIEESYSEAAYEYLDNITEKEEYVKSYKRGIMEESVIIGFLGMMSIYVIGLAIATVAYVISKTHKAQEQK